MDNSKKLRGLGQLAPGGKSDGAQLRPQLFVASVQPLSESESRSRVDGPARRASKIDTVAQLVLPRGILVQRFVIIWLTVIQIVSYSNG